MTSDRPEGGGRYVWESAQARLKEFQREIDEVSSEILDPSQEQELLQLESQRGHAEKLRQELANLIARNVGDVCQRDVHFGREDRSAG
jgi:hypothetical protein